MTDPDRVKLLFGPYRPRPLKRGNRATCLYRDATVVITGWSDARIPWPRCRALESLGAGSGLLVDDELARAIRHESAAALMYWWGIGHRAAAQWRRTFGVGRTDSEGSRRLIQAAAEKGAQAAKAREWTDEECDRRSLTSIELNLGQYLPTGYHGPRWTAEELALLGTVPDEEAARKTGRTPGAVRQKREELGIPNPTTAGRWTENELALLGTLPDWEVAQRLGRSVSSVTQKRCKLRIPAPGDGRKRKRVMSEPRVIGRVPFTDGTEREVYADRHGRQYVRGDQGERVYGQWLAAPDEAVVVEGLGP